MLIDQEIGLQSCYTLFAETAKVILSTKDTLSALTIFSGEHRQHYKDMRYRGTCGKGHSNFRYTYVPWRVTMATAFLEKILLVLDSHSFPRLANVFF
jgi:hypothetical protein